MNDAIRLFLSQLFSLNIDTNGICDHVDSMITAEQSRAGRALLDWSQAELAEAANLGLSTIRDFEKKRRIPHINNLTAIRAALESAGVEFIPENGSGPGVRLKKPG